MKNSKATTPETNDMDNNPLHEVFLDELADMYHAENQLTKALPKMIKAAKSQELKDALQGHLDETQEQINRLEAVFESLGEKTKSKTCKGMQGILSEGDEMVAESKGKPSLDAVIISAGQKVEHYEIASYGTLVAWAEEMGHDEAAELLKENLEEEKAADEKLTEIAESSANEMAEG